MTCATGMDFSYNFRLASVVILFCFFSFKSEGKRDIFEIKLAVLVPESEKTSRYFSLHHVQPAIQSAIDQIQNNTDYIYNFEFLVTYADSNCSIDQGMNEAIKIYINGSVHVFLGPTCDYAVAPVARQVKYWNIPILTCGGMAREFLLYRKGTFQLLTRVGPSYFNSLAMYFLQMLNHLKWNKIKLLFKRNGQDHVFEDFCHFAISALHYELRYWNPLIKEDVYKLDDNDIDYILTKEVSHNYGDQNFLHFFGGYRGYKFHVSSCKCALDFGKLIAIPRLNSLVFKTYFERDRKLLSN